MCFGDARGTARWTGSCGFGVVVEETDLRIAPQDCVIDFPGVRIFLAGDARPIKVAPIAVVGALVAPASIDRLVVPCRARLDTQIVVCKEIAFVAVEAESC